MVTQPPEVAKRARTAELTTAKGYVMVTQCPEGGRGRVLLSWRARRGIVSVSLVIQGA